MGYIGRTPDGIFDGVVIDFGDWPTVGHVQRLVNAGLAVERVPLDWALANLGTAAQCAATAAPTDAFDAAIASSSAIDRTAPQKDMRVPSWEEREAERKRVAERIASMWGSLK